MPLQTISIHYPHRISRCIYDCAFVHFRDASRPYRAGHWNKLRTGTCLGVVSWNRYVVCIPFLLPFWACLFRLPSVVACLYSGTRCKHTRHPSELGKFLRDFHLSPPFSNRYGLRQIESNRISCVTGTVGVICKREQSNEQVQNKPHGTRSEQDKDSGVRMAEPRVATCPGALSPQIVTKTANGGMPRQRLNRIAGRSAANLSRHKIGRGRRREPQDISDIGCRF